MSLETIVELCEVNEVHDATLNQIKAKMPKEERDELYRGWKKAVERAKSWEDQ